MRFCVVAATAVVLIAAFYWSLIDVVTPFLITPLQGVAWLLLLAAFAWAAVVQVRSGVPGRAKSYPLLVCVAGAALAIFPPWTAIWLAANERVHRSDRERIVREVQNGTLRPNVGHNASLIALGSDAPDVSKGGNEIVVEEHDGRRYVFFYTYRGILDSYSGFLFVPTGGDPRSFTKAAEATAVLERRRPNWFFLAHR